MSSTEPASSEFYLDQALVAFERARELTDPEERPDLHGVILHDIADVYEATGRTAEAVEMYRRSAEVKRRGSSPRDLLITLLTLASRLIDGLEFDEARTVTEEAADVLSRPDTEMGPSFRASRAYTLGSLYERLGDTGEPGAHRLALEAYEWSLSLYDRDLEPGACAGTLRARARMQSVLGRAQDAATSLTEAVRYFECDGDRQAQAVVLIDLGRLYHRLAEDSASRAVVSEPRPADGVPAVEVEVEVDGPERGRGRGHRVAERGRGRRRRCGRRRGRGRHRGRRRGRRPGAPRSGVAAR